MQTGIELVPQPQPWELCTCADNRVTCTPNWAMLCGIIAIGIIVLGVHTIQANKAIIQHCQSFRYNRFRYECLYNEHYLTTRLFTLGIELCVLGCEMFLIVIFCIRLQNHNSILCQRIQFIIASIVHIGLLYPAIYLLLNRGYDECANDKCEKTVAVTASLGSMTLVFSVLLPIIFMQSCQGERSRV